MELNKEQIIKALECCSSSDGVSACESGCPYWGGDYDTCLCIEDPNYLSKNALSLIKELTEENEGMANICNANDALIAKLQKENKELIINMNAYGLTAKNLAEENERLKSVEFTCGFVKPHKVLECPIFDEIERAKADTVRKMQAEIEARCIKGGIYPAFVKSTIDNIAEELISDGS